ncbi:hypothetical protein ElyMa_005045800 [Elysia marginata]|uniref:Uncharacterized protein n=1 Tax=Elysia marginata TaxID=1093978 RepID=A0AAV4JCB9_9GAST|nr:hypothetical protein ElyMa_005045800 [Elysia marginata]
MWWLTTFSTASTVRSVSPVPIPRARPANFYKPQDGKNVLMVIIINLIPLMHREAGTATGLPVFQVKVSINEFIFLQDTGKIILTSQRPVEGFDPDSLLLMEIKELA